ncbi:MAG TPA: invasion associated locus B family protein [Stellaceae bacterium]|nr:invasion associated locus B family protein [Stellaceae bacterium]
MIAALASPVLAQPSGAAKPKAAESKTEHLGDAQNWSAYVDTLKSGKVCYLVGHPVKSEPANLKRGDIMIYVTHRPAEKTFNVVSFMPGYPYKDGSDAEFTVEKTKFDLFTSKESAWARDAATEKAIVEAMVKGKDATLKGTSARGTTTTDTFSLAGFTQALGMIDKACGVKR